MDVLTLLSDRCNLIQAVFSRTVAAFLEDNPQKSLKRLQEALDEDWLLWNLRLLAQQSQVPQERKALLEFNIQAAGAQAALQSLVDGELIIPDLDQRLQKILFDFSVEKEKLLRRLPEEEEFWPRLSSPSPKLLFGTCPLGFYLEFTESKDRRNLSEYGFRELNPHGPQILVFRSPIRAQKFARSEFPDIISGITDLPLPGPWEDGFWSTKESLSISLETLRVMSPQSKVAVSRSRHWGVDIVALDQTQRYWEVRNLPVLRCLAKSPEESRQRAKEKLLDPKLRLPNGGPAGEWVTTGETYCFGGAYMLPLWPKTLLESGVNLRFGRWELLGL